MNTTDQAFIAAIRQSLPTGTASSPAAAPPASTQRIDLPHSGPRLATNDTATRASTVQSRKAPLSEHRARRESELTANQPLRPGVEVDALPWPAVVEELAVKARQALLDLLAGVTKRLVSNEAPAISLVGTGPGVGTTTTLLAIARLVASVGGRVAVVDASGVAGAASCLGVRRFAHLDSRIEPVAIDDLLVSSRGCGTSVLAVAGEESGPFAVAALHRLVSTHDLVLIDAGDSTTWFHAAGADRSCVLVIDEDNADNDNARHATVARLEAAGFATMGFVETFTPAT